MMQDNKIIVLVGIMGCGKSSVAKILSQRLKIPLYDLDVLIENDMQEKIANIFSLYGEEFFRKKESAMLKDIIARKDYSFVLSLGGGTFVSEANQKILDKQNIITIFLHTKFEILVERLQHDTKRPLLQQPNKWDVLKNLYQVRLPYYQKAKFEIDNSTLNKEETADKILELLGEV
jgi:shikimate kinase